MAENAPSPEPDPALEPELAAAADPQGLERVPGIVSVAASAYLNAGSWALAKSLMATKRVAGALTAPSRAAELVSDVATGTREVLSTIIELTDRDHQTAETVAEQDPAPQVLPEPTPLLQGELQLQQAGQELLERSLELDDGPVIHPAYERILTELSPDEARVLRLLLLHGPQPSVDVRSGGIFGLLNTHIVKQGLTMIGPRAALRYPDQLPAYLNNLYRLGLVWVSPETIRDYQRYQVLEAQPQVVQAVHSVRWARVVRRSIHLTPFGADFALTCLSQQREAHPQLPPHSAPKVPAPEPGAGGGEEIA